jgi:putative transposase
MFQDEARFGRLSDPRRCWAPRGIRPHVSAQLVREFTYAFAAVSPQDGVLESLVLPEVTAETMSLFLAEVAARHPADFILMFLDQAGWHKAKALVVPVNMRLEWLPPYSPECNPVEHLWEEIREKWFANRLFRHLDGVEDTLVTALHTLEQETERIASITGFDWIISIPLNAT